MSRYLQHNEMVYELRDTPLQRRHRQAKLRVVYALVDPKGYDARKLAELDTNAYSLWPILKEMHAAQQKTADPGDSLAGHVPDRAATPLTHRVAVGSA